MFVAETPFTGSRGALMLPQQKALLVNGSAQKSIDGQPKAMASFGSSMQVGSDNNNNISDINNNTGNKISNNININNNINNINNIHSIKKSTSATTTSTTTIDARYVAFFGKPRWYESVVKCDSEENGNQPEGTNAFHLSEHLLFPPRHVRRRIFCRKRKKTRQRAAEKAEEEGSAIGGVMFLLQPEGCGSDGRRYSAVLLLFASTTLYHT